MKPWVSIVAKVLAILCRNNVDMADCFVSARRLGGLAAEGANTLTTAVIEPKSEGLSVVRTASLDVLLIRGSP